MAIQYVILANLMFGNRCHPLINMGNALCERIVRILCNVRLGVGAVNGSGQNARQDKDVL